MYPTLRVYDPTTNEDVKVSADNPVPSEIIKNIANYLEPLGTSSLTVDNTTAKWLYQANIPNGATLAGIVVDDSAIRYTLDGVTAPVAASVGTSLAVGEYLLLNTNDIFKFKCISQTATSAILRIEFFRYTATSLRETTIADPLPSFQIVSADLSGALPNSNISWSGGVVNGSVDKNGNTRTSTVNLPIYDYDSYTLIGKKGYCYHSAYTTKLLQSETLGTTWATTRATVSSNIALPLAPSGSATADKLLLDGTSANTHLLVQSLTLTSTNTYTTSVFVHPLELYRLQVRLRDVAGNGFFYRFNCDTGLWEMTFSGSSSAGNGSLISSKAVAFQNSYYRVALTGIVDSGGGSETCYNDFFLSPNDGSSLSFDGDSNSGLALWGANLTQGKILYPYVTTTTGEVTVAAVVSSITTANIPRFSKSQATFLIVGSFLGHDTNTQYLFSLDNAGTSHLVAYYDNTNNKIRVVLTIAGTAVYDSVTNNTLLSVAEDTEFKLAVSLKGGQINVSMYNGASYASDSKTSYTIEMPVATHLRIASNLSGTNQLDGYENIYYTPFYKTLSAITTDIENL